jgi:recombinational DNA repair ATPase RecF
MKIIELEIRNIRGIKKLTLKPNTENFLVWGTNGTGKSAVVDAIDFLLTGRIHRLMGIGTAGITIEAHGSHIDCNDPSQAYVRAIVQLKEPDSQIEIRRCMDDPDTLHGSEDFREQLIKIEEIAKRGQHVLTRREILRFVTATGGNRAKEIQELMNLIEIENIRANLVSVKNQTSRDFRASLRDLEAQETQVALRVGLKEFIVAGVLSKINENRALLKGEEIEELAVDLLQAGIDPPKTLETSPGINLEVFENQINQLASLTSQENQLAIQNTDQQLRSLVAGIHEDTQILRSFTSRELVQTGLELLDDSGSCPLCDRPWEPGELEIYLNKKLEDAMDVGARVDVINGLSQELSTEITRVKNILNNIIDPVDFTKLEESANSLKQWKTDLETLKKVLEKPLQIYHQIEFSGKQVQRILAPDGIKEIVNEIKAKAREVFPKSTPEQTAWDTLTKLTVDVKQLENARIKNEHAEVTAQRAEILHREFVASRDIILGELYDGIRNRFVELYRELHEEDEGEFEATLQLSDASLDFEVDFYGRGSHPPHALHSEGHQDSMGVCLFLALSEKLTHGEIALIILDDVVMSVDKSHRRNLCEVLADNFPDNQFLITTHDQTWAMQLKSNAVVKSKNTYQFFDWDLDSGPSVSDTKNLWDRIDKDLELNDVPAAAAKLRRGSEQYFAEVCDRLVALVPFDLDGRFELGDLLTSATKRYKELLVEGTQVAISWNNGNAQDVELLSSERKKIYKDLNIEQWAVNVNVHYNDWAGFEKEDFQPVVDAFRALFDLYTCPNCGGMLYLVKEGKENKNVRCPCNEVNWNLEKKKN